MIESEIFKWLLLLLFLLLMLLLTSAMSNAAQNERQRAFGGGAGQGQPKPDPHGQPQEPQDDGEGQGSKEDRVRRILQKDPELADDLARQAGLGENQDFQEPKTIKRIANNLPEATIQMFEVASRKALMDLDLESKAKLVRVPSGGVYQEPGRMRSFDDIIRLRPSEFLKPKDIRNWRIMTGQAQKMNRFDMRQDLIALHIVEDVSPSMWLFRMKDGKRRWIWARGVTMKLARLALKGRSIFLYRQFSGRPHQQLWTVTTKDDAKAFVDFLASTAPNGSDTNIGAAIAAAVADIKNAGKKFTEAHIMLVTDGEDNYSLSANTLKKILGTIQLHVVIIGGGSGALREGATTYQVIE